MEAARSGCWKEKREPNNNRTGMIAIINDVNMLPF